MKYFCSCSLQEKFGRNWKSTTPTTGAMLFTINVDRKTHNYLKVKLKDRPLTVADPIGYFLDLLVQTQMYHLKMVESKPSSLAFKIPVEMEVWNQRRDVNLLNVQESYMFCKHVEYWMTMELKEELDNSECFSDTFFEFQEKYWLSDLDFSRDKMYKWYERYQTGKIRQRYWVKAPEWV